MTDDATVARWVEAYERAWRTPGTAGLGSLFPDDAMYLHSPYEQPVVGLPAIQQMWEEDRDGADEVFTMTSDLLAVDGDTAIVRAEVRYGIPVRQEYRDLWVLRFGADGRCRWFEEWPYWPGRHYSARAESEAGRLPGRAVARGATSTQPSAELIIRTMRSDEYPAVRELSISAFGGDAKLGQLLDGLRSSWAWLDELAFVACKDDELVGHVLYTRALLDAPRRLVDVLVLGPLGVRPDMQGRGIGSRLITETLKVAAARTEPLVFLEGHPTYYPRFGFEQGAALGFVAPSLRIPAAAFMAYRLPTYEPWMTGTLVYPDAVWHMDAVGKREEDSPP